MKPLLQTLRPLARSGRLLGRLLFRIQPLADRGESVLARPKPVPGGTKKMFLGYLNDALSGGGRR